MKRKSYSLLFVLAAALSMIMLMTAISFAQGRYIGFGDDPDALSAKTVLVVGEKAEFKASEGVTIEGYELSNRSDPDAVAVEGAEITALKPGKAVFYVFYWFESDGTEFHTSTELTVNVEAAVGFGDNFDQTTEIAFGETTVINLNKSLISNGMMYTPGRVVNIDKINDNSYKVTAVNPGVQDISFFYKKPDGSFSGDITLTVTVNKGYISAADMTVAAPLCGEIVCDIGATARPKVTIAAGSNYSVYNDEELNFYGTFWLEADKSFIRLAEIEGGEEYIAEIHLMPSYGYYLDKNTVVTVNGVEVTDKEANSDDVLVVYAPMTAEHDSVAKITEKPTAKKTGIRTYTCQGCGEVLKTETVKFNPMKVKAKTATVKYSKVKKAKRTIARKKVLAVSNAKGTVTYKKVSGNKKILVNAKTGKVTVKKGLKKGTYKVKVKVTAAGNTTYANKTLTKTFKIKVK